MVKAYFRMIVRILMAFILIIIIAAIIFLVGFIQNGSFDPSLWTEGSRTTAVTLLSISSIFLLLGFTFIPLIFE